MELLPVLDTFLELRCNFFASLDQILNCFVEIAGKVDDSKAGASQQAEEEKAPMATATTASPTSDETEADLSNNPFDFSAMTGLLNVLRSPSACSTGFCLIGDWKSIMCT
jgi:hypothetical protein